MHGKHLTSSKIVAELDCSLVCMGRNVFTVVWLRPCGASPISNTGSLPSTLNSTQVFWREGHQADRYSSAYWRQAGITTHSGAVGDVGDFPWGVTRPPTGQRDDSKPYPCCKRMAYSCLLLPLIQELTADTGSKQTVALQRYRQACRVRKIER